jgi:hypothetical protein
LIWTDPQTLPWEEEERQALAEDHETRWLTQPFPPGVHVRPEGGEESQTVLMLWDYHKRGTRRREWMNSIEAPYGLGAMLPGLTEYLAGCRVHNSTAVITGRGNRRSGPLGVERRRGQAVSG